jgi:hypothetical protein
MRSMFEPVLNDGTWSIEHYFVGAIPVQLKTQAMIWNSREREIVGSECQATA